MKIRKAITVSILFATSLACAAADNIMTREKDGTCKINTATLCQEKGYNGATPVMVYIKDGVIKKIEALPNEETKGYFKRLEKKFLHSWDGVSVSKVEKMTIDGHTGATYSAKAVEANVKAAVKYYNSNKKKK